MFQLVVSTFKSSVWQINIRIYLGMSISNLWQVTYVVMYQEC